MATKNNDSRGLAELEKEKVSLKTRLQEAAEEKQWGAVQERSYALRATEVRIEKAEKKEKAPIKKSEKDQSETEESK